MTEFISNPSTGEVEQKFKVILGNKGSSRTAGDIRDPVSRNNFHKTHSTSQCHRGAPHRENQSGARGGVPFRVDVYSNRLDSPRIWSPKLVVTAEMAKAGSDASQNTQTIASAHQPALSPRAFLFPLA